MTAPVPQPDTASPQPQKIKKYGLPLIITGAVLAAVGFLVIVTSSQQYNLCNSDVGTLGQMFNAQARANCQQDDIGHNVCLVIAVAGLALVVWGVIRMFWKRQAQAR